MKRQKEQEKSKKPITDGRRAQLRSAREVLLASGKSPRRLAAEARARVVEWTNRWGYTSSTIIQELLGKTSGGYALKLEVQGWLHSIKTESGMPSRIFMLTESGKAEAERHSLQLLRYPEIDPYRVNQRLIRHYLLAQEITVNALRAGAISGYATERMLDEEGDKAGIKRPDVVWYFPNGERVAIEVELSAKWARHLDEFVLGILIALGLLEGCKAQFDRFVIASDSKAILERYRQAMTEGALLNIWEKNKRGHFAISESMTIPKELLEMVSFQFISDEEEEIDGEEGELE